MLRLSADQAGVIVTTYAPPAGTDLPPAGPNDLDVDPDSNPALVAALDTDGRSFCLLDGALTRNGEPYAINPPAPPEPTQAERIAQALLSLPELSDSSKALLVAALGGG